MISVDVVPGVLESLRAICEREAAPARYDTFLITATIAFAASRLLADELEGSVRPWDLPPLRRRAADLAEVTSARVVLVDEHVLVAELLPGGQRILFRGVDDDWRLVRFVDGDDISVRPETTRRVALSGWGPDSVLAALGIVKPEHVELQVTDEYLGQGETETRYRYEWTDGGRSIIAEEVKNEIFDGATPYSTYVRGVIVDGAHGVLLTGNDDSALITEG
jgi:hypothetical protein